LCRINLREGNKLEEGTKMDTLEETGGKRATHQFLLAE